MTHPISIDPLLELREFGIAPSQICFDMVTMESWKFIACRDKAMNSSSISVIELSNPSVPISLPLPTDSVIMHPRDKIIAVRSGKMLQLIDIEQDKIVKVHNNHEVVIFWRWIDENTIGFVTHDTTVFHWALDGDSTPVRMFSVDHKIRERCRIVDYRADREHKFLVLIGIAKNSRGGEGGCIQLYSTESAQSRFFDGNAACFVKLNLEGSSHLSNLLVYSSNKGESMLKVQLLWSHQDGDIMKCHPPSSVSYTSECDTDFPVSIHASSREGVVYLVTKRGFLHVFYLEPTTHIYSCRISEDFISIATDNSNEGIVGITMKGLVFSISMKERTMIKHVSESNQELARKINDRWMWPVVPSEPFLRLPEKEPENVVHWRGKTNNVENYLTDSIKNVLVAAGQDPLKIRKKDIKFVYDFVEQYKQDQASKEANCESPSPRSISPIDESIPSSSTECLPHQQINYTPASDPPTLPLKPMPPVPAPRPSLAKTENKNSHAELLARAEKAEKERDELAARFDELEKKYKKALVLLGTPKSTDVLDERASMKEFARNSCKIGVQGLLDEFKGIRLETHPIGEKPKIAFDANMDKNRYQDVYCVDESRVILYDGSNDYINANWVDVQQGKRLYICTQAPMANTIEDFWRMVWQEQCRSIVMLCNIVEFGKKKCEQYWPEEVGQEVSYGPFQVCTTAKETYEKTLTVTTLEISSGCKTLELEHILWNDWPDRGVPSESLVCFKLIDRIKNRSPTVIHCSAGIGRTGTIVALDLITTSLQGGEVKSAKEMVIDLRTKRHGSVQTDIQYLFIHRAIIEYGLSKQMLDDSEVRAFIDEYDALCELRGFF